MGRVAQVWIWILTINMSCSTLQLMLNKRNSHEKNIAVNLFNPLICISK